MSNFFFYFFPLNGNEKEITSVYKVYKWIYKRHNKYKCVLGKRNSRKKEEEKTV